MKKYENPRIELMTIKGTDIICTSGNQGLIIGGSGVVGGNPEDEENMFD